MARVEVRMKGDESRVRAQGQGGRREGKAGTLMPMAQVRGEG